MVLFLTETAIGLIIGAFFFIAGVVVSEASQNDEKVLLVGFAASALAVPALTGGVMMLFGFSMDHFSLLSVIEALFGIIFYGVAYGLVGIWNAFLGGSN